MNTKKIVDIKIFGAVAVISLIVLGMSVEPLTASIPIITPKYAPKSSDLPHVSDYNAVRHTEQDIKGRTAYQASDLYGLDLVYSEGMTYGDISGENNGNVWIYELSTVSEAKTCYDRHYEKHASNADVHHTIAIDIGDEGVSSSFFDGKIILFRTGRFVVKAFCASGPIISCEDFARITEQNIERATATPTRPTMPPTTESTFRQTPQVENDSDSDGVPDEYDYAPHDPEVQTKSDAKTPGFGAIFAIGNLLAVAYLIFWRRKYRI